MKKAFVGKTGAIMSTSWKNKRGKAQLIKDCLAGRENWKCLKTSLVFQINFLKANYQSLQNYTHLLWKVNSNKSSLVILYPNLRPAVNEMGASVSLSPAYRMQIYGTFSQAFSPLLSGAQYSQSIVASPWRAPLKILTLHQSSHLTMVGHLSFSQHSQIFLLHVGFLRMVEWSEV